jgi:hypothetical protein
MENSMEILQIIKKQSYHKIEQFHFSIWKQPGYLFRDKENVLLD